MSIIVTNRSEPLIDEGGLASIRFADLLESLVDTVNELTALPVNTQDLSYTFILNDAGGIVRKTSSTTQQTYTIPSNDAVAFDIGTVIEVQNDGTVRLDIGIDIDTLIFETDGTTGDRSIVAAGSGRFVKVAATKWKCRGQQMT